jgi:hypothetical protein
MVDVSPAILYDDCWSIRRKHKYHKDKYEGSKDFGVETNTENHEEYNFVGCNVV